MLKNLSKDIAMNPVALMDAKIQTGQSTEINFKVLGRYVFINEYQKVIKFFVSLENNGKKIVLETQLFEHLALSLCTTVRCMVSKITMVSTVYHTVEIITLPKPNLKFADFVESPLMENNIEVPRDYINVYTHKTMLSKILNKQALNICQSFVTFKNQEGVYCRGILPIDLINSSNLHIVYRKIVVNDDVYTVDYIAVKSTGDD